MMSVVATSGTAAANQLSCWYNTTAAHFVAAVIAQTADLYA